MAKFQLPTIKNTPHTVSRKSIFFLCCFRVPEHLREGFSATDLDGLEQDLLYGFYSRPSIGSYHLINGHRWVLAEEEHAPVRYGAKGKRTVPRLLMWLTDEQSGIRPLEEDGERIVEE